MTSTIGVGSAAFHTGGDGRAGRHRLPRRVPPRGAGAAGRLQRGVHPRPGLGAEPPHPRRPAGWCGSRPRCGSPTARAPRAGARQAVPRLRPLAPGRRPPPPRHHQPALPRAADGARRHRGGVVRRGGHPVAAPVGPRPATSPRSPSARLGRQGLSARPERLWLPGDPADHAHVVGLGLPHQPALARPGGRAGSPAGATRSDDPAGTATPAGADRPDLGVAPQQQEAPRAQ